jgi:hypothetical protein
VKLISGIFFIIAFPSRNSIAKKKKKKKKRRHEELAVLVKFWIGNQTPRMGSASPPHRWLELPQLDADPV